MHYERTSRILLALVAAACGACGASDAPRHRSLSDDDIAAFGAERSTARTNQAPSTEATPSIELAGGERLEELRALIRFDPGEGSAPTCALYALRARGQALEEGRATVPCGNEEANGEANGELTLSPIQDARGPLLVAALTGANVEPQRRSIAPTSPRTVHLWLTTDRRHVDGMAAPLRWPTPGAAEAPVGHRPANLSEVWEAVMYPARYRESD